MKWAPPPAEWRYYADNFLDHADHDVTNWANVLEINRIAIEPQQDPDDPAFTIFVIKNIDSQTEAAGFYCNDCARELDIPNHAEWNL
jgi:hypothetical protein